MLPVPREGFDSEAIPNKVRVRSINRSQNLEGTMKNIKFVVKVNRGGAHAPQYVLRVDRLPIQTTTNRKLALVMGRFTAEDAVKSMQNSHCVPELVSVRVSA